MVEAGSGLGGLSVHSNRMLAHPRPRSRTASRHGWLFVVIALWAMASQMVLAAVPLLEGRDGRLASHVESGGAKGHFSHNDATCAACQARSIHGTAPRAEPPSREAGLLASTVVAAVARVVSVERQPKDNPRAPPA